MNFRKAQQGGLAIRCQSDTKIFLKMLGFPAFSKTLAYSVQCQLNAIWYQESETDCAPTLNRVLHKKLTEF